MLVFTDSVLSAISSEIAALEPEQGGALFGIQDTNVICHLEYDREARRSHAIYFPSHSLQHQVHNIERETRLVFRGIIHSHPGQLSEPSGQDLVAFGKSLADNLHLAAFVAPIVTTGGNRLFEAHEVELVNGARMSTYVASRTARPIWRRGTRLASAKPCTVAVMPIDEHVGLLCSALDVVQSEAQIERGYFSIGHVSYISLSLHIQEAEIIMLFPPIYPMSQPLVMLSVTGREPAFLDLPFGDELNHTLERPNWVVRLTAAIRTAGV
jgi:hypothetical protein